MSSLNIFAQPKPRHYTLLWQISGNGLEKPSYLFGTMHVKDRRVFNFSDSVMLALQGCKRFALEVQPDTVMRLMMNLFQNPDTLRSLDQLLSKKDYQKLDARFRKKYGYPLSKANPMAVESLMEPDEDKPDDEVSFVDAYLYGIARTQNKKILGLEDASSQINSYYGSSELLKNRLLAMLGDDYENESDEALEEMVKIYSAGNLSSIYNFATETGMIDSEIVARNKVMASSFEKYSKGSTLFAAVGAAHLPGPNGVLALLRRAGYQVRSVSASFTGVPDKFHIDYTKIDWAVYNSSSKGFSAIFPGEPFKFRTFESERLVYYDMANGLDYAVLAFPGNRYNQKNLSVDTILTNLVGLKKYTLISSKNIHTKSGLSKELIIKANKEWIRMHIIEANNMIYCTVAGSKQNKLDQPFINKFFDSFSTFAPVEAVQQKWITYTNDTAGYRAEMPSQPVTMVKLLPKTIGGTTVNYVLHISIGVDSVNNKFYLVRYNDYPQGYYLKNKQMFFDAIKGELKNEGATSGDTTKIWKDGNEGRQITAYLKNGTTLLMQYYARGSRVYALAEGTMEPNAKPDTDNAFFKSFHFLPFMAAIPHPVRSDSLGFEVKMVSEPLVKKDTNENYYQFLTHTVSYFSHSPTSGAAYSLECSKISSYFRIASLDSLYKRLIKDVTRYPDSLVKLDTVMASGIEGREYLKVQRGSSDTTRGRIVVAGNRIFILSSRADPSELCDKQSDTFFNSLVILPQKKPAVAIFSSKAKKICKDLSSADTLVFKRAKGALSYYDFDQQELPFVYQALQKDYPDDTLYSSARASLIAALKTTHDSLTVPFLTKLYARLNGKDKLRENILNTIVAADKKTGYDVYIHLLADTSAGRLTSDDLYRAFSPLSDSTAIAAKYFDKLLPLMKYDNYRKTIIGLASNMADDEKHLYDGYIRNVYPALTAHALSDLGNYLAVKDTIINNWSIAILRYLNLMQKITGEAINDTFSNRYLEKDTSGTWRKYAVFVRIYNHLNIPKVVITKLLDSLDSRYDTMNALNDCHELNTVPLKYRRPDAFASLCLYQAAQDDDDDAPENITLLGSITVSGSVYYAYKFKMPDMDKDATYFGLAGPYQPGSDQLDFKKYHALTNFDKLETDWQKQAKNFVPKLNKAYK